MSAQQHLPGRSAWMVVGVTGVLILLVGLPWLLAGLLILVCLIVGFVTVITSSARWLRTGYLRRQPYYRDDLREVRRMAPDFDNWQGHPQPHRAAAPSPSAAPVAAPPRCTRGDSFMRPALLTGVLFGLL